MEKLKIEIAGHLFSLQTDFPSGNDFLKARYSEFLADENTGISGEGKNIFSLKVAMDKEAGTAKNLKLIRKFNDEAPYLWLYENTGGMLFFGFSNNPHESSCILSTEEPCSRNASLAVFGEYDENKILFCINNSLMLLYATNTADKATLLIHASAITYKGQSVVFLGKSGTGKSTHASLWIKNIKDCEMLNDDNPVIIDMDGKLYVSGSPWSGKSTCYKNRKYPLKAIVRLKQADRNKITRMDKMEAYCSLLSSCSYIRWNRTITDGIHSTVSSVISGSESFELECRPDKEAAMLCFKTTMRHDK